MERVGGRREENTEKLKMISFSFIFLFKRKMIGIY